MNSIRSLLLKILRIPFYFRPFEMILRMLTIDRQYGTFLTQLPPKHITYPKPSIRNAKVRNIKYCLDISDLVGWYAYWGFVDKPRLKLYSLINQGDFVVDVGANLGEVSLNAAELVGEKGRVYSFEPFPVNFAKLATNLSLNSFENLEIVNKGLGNKTQFLPMVDVEENNAGMSRISATPSQDRGNDVEIIKLDDFVEAIELSRVDLIKIDVEGFEMNVLEGAHNTLEKFKPKLFVELIDELLRIQNTSTSEVIKFLESFGYKIFYSETDQPVRSSDNFENTQFDMVALIETD